MTGPCLSRRRPAAPANPTPPRVQPGYRGATCDTLHSPNDETNPLPLPSAGGFCSCDADVETYEDWVYYTDWWIAITTGNILVERSNDTMRWAAQAAGWRSHNVTTTGLHILPWLAATGNGTVTLGRYGSFAARGDPADQPTDTRWHAYLAESHDGGLSGTATQVSETPVKKGNLCPGGSGCSGDRKLLDYWSVAYAADGRLHVSYSIVSGAAAPYYAQSEALVGRTC
jgi:hypothetical protein